MKIESNPDQRAAENLDFIRRLVQRRPQDRAHYEKLLGRKLPGPQGGLESTVHEAALESSALPETPAEKWAAIMSLETIVFKERPVLFIKDGVLDTSEVTTLGPEAIDLVDQMKSATGILHPLLPLIGRIDASNASFPYAGTGWFVADGIVVTNRHVASLIAKHDGRKFVFRQGIGTTQMAPELNNAHEYDDLPAPMERRFKVLEVLYIEPDSGPHDIAFLKVDRKTDGSQPQFISIAAAEAGPSTLVCVVGYPAWAPNHVIPNQQLMNELYRSRFEVKRAAPGYAMSLEDGVGRHDCTTLGGNSGSVVIDLKKGVAVGLHFSGLYEKANYAVSAATLKKYVDRKIWNEPIVIAEEPRPQPVAVSADAQSANPSIIAGPVSQGLAAGGASQTVNFSVPLNVAVSLNLGQIVAAAGSLTGPAGSPPAPISAERVERAVKELWPKRPPGVLAARVGYLDDGSAIADEPCIALSVAPERWAAAEAAGPHEFQGIPVRYFPAEAGEQLDALPVTESVGSIAYDDDARTSKDFSFDWVNEEMDVTLHVGPEFSWDVLKRFLLDPKENGAPSTKDEHFISAMYEFHADHIKDALETRLKTGSTLRLVLDNATFPGKKKMDDPPDDGDFDRLKVFEKWARDFKFERIVAPEGLSGLISDSYHIKVTVRSDDTFWLSSGNWKAGSSQPLITAEELAKAERGEKDLRGNREWHVVVKNKTLAKHFRSHISQDFKRSEDLDGGPIPPSLLEEAVFINVPLEESMILERRAPSTIVKSETITNKKIKVRPLLTPDRKGAVFSEAVLDLINKAQESLYFQIPYIGMPSFPGADRGYIDKLINALTDKLNSLPDARLILRSGSSAFSSPTHAAWHFKSKGVDIGNRLRVIEDHHTKGMIVDGKRVLIGSHNWSAPGVTLNRDASLLFHDERVAQFYLQAFEIDWARANKITPKKFVKPPRKPKDESIALIPGVESPSSFKQISLAELRRDA